MLAATTTQRTVWCPAGAVKPDATRPDPAQRRGLLLETEPAFGSGTESPVLSSDTKLLLPQLPTLNRPLFWVTF